MLLVLEVTDAWNLDGPIFPEFFTFLIFFLNLCNKRMKSSYYLEFGYEQDVNFIVFLAMIEVNKGEIKSIKNDG